MTAELESSSTALGPNAASVVRRLCWLLLAAISLTSAASSHAACAFCESFQAGTSWGNANIKALTEASGIAASSANPGVLWTHNDGARGKLYALGANGSLLATYDLDLNVDDVEDVAVGSGPAAGVSYLYVGDIGGSKETNGLRSEVMVLRVAEPTVNFSWVTAPKSVPFTGVERFWLTYPDGSYDAETLLFDPVAAEVLVVTKQTDQARVYRANLATAVNFRLTMEFVCSVPFGLASGGDIAADGTAIVLRREDYAMIWTRCDNEPILSALARLGQSIPVIGPPTEPNGEGIAFLRDGSGYVTISEGTDPAIYYFRANCPTPPNFLWPLANKSIFAGASTVLASTCVGYPVPAFSWTLNDVRLTNQTSPVLQLNNVTSNAAGQYRLTASNSTGVATSMATVTVRTKPDLRITEAQSSPAAGPSVPTADWWELTSFETEPVDLSRWRFNDNSGGLTGPYTIASGVVIRPGESMIFVEGLTPAQFIDWWGAANLPTNIQVVSYTGSGLGLGAAGDGLRLWNDVATEPNDTVAAADFGAADAGVTFNYDPVNAQFGAKSVLGVNGVFRAARASDIGSPGRIIAPAVRPSLTIEVLAQTVRISFDTLLGHLYSLETSGDLAPGSWTSTGDTLRATSNTRTYFERPRTSQPAFYRLVVE